MRLARARRAGFALLLGLAIGGCEGATAKRADGGRDGSGNETSGSSDTMALSADAWLVADDGPGAVSDGAPAEDATPLSPTADAALVPDGEVSRDALVVDALLPSETPPTDGSDGRRDGTLGPEGPQLADGPPRADGPAGPEVLPPDGSARPDIYFDRPPSTDPPQPDRPDGLGANQVTIAIVGDTAEKGRTSLTRGVASLISGRNPAVAALFIAGDCVRYDGSGSLLSFFQKYWEPASEANLGQFDDIVFPQLGNHEYLEDKAQGYFDFFASRFATLTALPTYHGDAGTVGRGWYSVDLNGWHVVSLNANCDEISGGCQTGGVEEQWLAADLASHAGMPTIAVWHEPRWTCTSDGHASDRDLQPFWARLYDAHADFVFNGHNHFYQRYKPLNKASTAAEDTTAGLTEIIVGTGGSSTYEVCASSEDTRVAKALDGDGSLGAMFFTMGSDGSYSWEFRLKSDGSVFDAGSGRSHNVP